MLIAFNKPYGVLSQFNANPGDEGQRTLKEFNFPPKCLPLGRLDMDSEGLLLFTDEKSLEDRLLNPRYQHRRRYLVLVEGQPDDSALTKLRSGTLIIKGHRCLPCRAKSLKQAPPLPPRNPPVRVRQKIIDTWLRLETYPSASGKSSTTKNAPPSSRDNFGVRAACPRFPKAKAPQPSPKKSPRLYVRHPFNQSLNPIKTNYLVFSLTYSENRSIVSLMSQNELSRRERQIMDILYAQGPSTVAQVTSRMPDDLSRNAVRTFLTLLEGKNSVTRTKEGREFIYQPATEKSDAAQSALSKVLDVFFDGSLSDAVAARFSGSKKKISPDELTELEQLIKEARRKS